MVIDAMRAIATCKRFMDTATMRKRGSVETTSRGVCVTNIRTLRSGVHGNGHAPFWSSGRRSDPPIDCNKRLAHRRFCLCWRKEPSDVEDHAEAGSCADDCRDGCMGWRLGLTHLRQKGAGSADWGSRSKRREMYGKPE